MVTQAKKLSPRRQAFANLYATGTLSAVEAAVQAGYARTTALAKSSQWLDDVGTVEAIEAKQQSLAVQSDYSIATWRTDLLDDIQAAKADGSHSAVIKGRELLGRHIGALKSERGISRDDAEAFTFLGAMMERYRSGELQEQQVQPAIEAESRVTTGEEREGAGEDGGTG